MKRISSRQLRIVWIILGIALLVWLSLEGQSHRSALFFSLLVCVLATISLVQRWRWIGRSRSLAIILLCTLAGLAVVPVGLLLMALKTGLHAHPAPDFTPDQITWTISRLPFWGLVGFLGGCSVFLWLRTQNDPPQSLN